MHAGEPAREADAALSLALPQTATLGEGLQWDERSGRWWWTDIQAGTLHTWAPGEAASLRCRMPERLGCFAHARSGRLILGLAKRLYLGAPAIDAVGGLFFKELEPLADVEGGDGRTRVNDGRCDRSGRFVFGTLNESADRAAAGSFYQYSMRHGLRRLALPGVVIANSICFSPDGTRMYFCDTASRLIHQCEYDSESAAVANIRPFVRIEDEGAWPDGSTIDAEACLWNAQWGAGQVCRYSPRGELLQRYRMPASNSTCPALGGTDGRQLMVTTARQDLSDEELAKQPWSGSLFGMRLERKLYLAEMLFDDSVAAVQDQGS